MMKGAAAAQTRLVFPPIVVFLFILTSSTSFCWAENNVKSVNISGFSSTCPQGNVTVTVNWTFKCVDLTPLGCWNEGDSATHDTKVMFFEYDPFWDDIIWNTGWYGKTYYYGTNSYSTSGVANLWDEALNDGDFNNTGEFQAEVEVDDGVPNSKLESGQKNCLVELSGLQLQRNEDGAVILKWRTSYEEENAGWHLFRYSKHDGYLQLNQDLIAPYQYDYKYIDTSAIDGQKYFYVLEDINACGRPEKHGPVWIYAGSETMLDVDHSGRIDGLDIVELSRLQGSIPKNGFGRVISSNYQLYAREFDRRRLSPLSALQGFMDGVRAGDFVLLSQFVTIPFRADETWIFTKADLETVWARIFERKPTESYHSNRKLVLYEPEVPRTIYSGFFAKMTFDTRPNLLVADVQLGDDTVLIYLQRDKQETWSVVGLRD